MKISGKRIVILMVLVLTAVCAYAEDPAPPVKALESTPHTLDEIYNTIKSINGDAQAEDVLLGKTLSTGLTGTMPDNGTVTITPGIAVQPIPVGYHTGSGFVAGDADLIAENIYEGVEIFGVTGTYHSKKSCAEPLSSNRWCDPGDGTVKDMSTGLVWLKKADWGGESAFWSPAVGRTDAHVRAVQLWDDTSDEANAGLSDGSLEGEWRLPTIEELKGLVNGTGAVSVGNPQVFTGVKDFYWSETSYTGNTANAWVVDMSDGSVSYANKSGLAFVWPVRSDNN